MYAIFENGGKQYKVKKDDVIKLEKFDCKKDQIITIEEILFYGDDSGNSTIGAPYVKDVAVKLKVIDVIKDKKVLIFKKKRRHNYRRKLGHRQNVVLLKVTDISIKSLKKSISNEKHEEKNNERNRS
ncbi:50S ribosomal protein L21 [Rickettsiales bacterium]|nr:50S ribosomal protein L21 [Rickettsiales bacterium]